MGWSFAGWDGKLDPPPEIRPTDTGWQPVKADAKYARHFHLLTRDEKQEVFDQWRGSSFYAQITYHHWIHMDSFLGSVRNGP